MSKLPDHLKEAYEAGYDAGFNGASMRNSHYGFFASHAHTEAWQVGKQKGEADRILVNAGSVPKHK